MSSATVARPSPLITHNSSLITRNSDVLIAGAVLMIVGMMIIPLPEVALDGLLTLNIAGALTILLVAIYTREPLGFSVFPSLLLLTTLFRLGLNISATRLILLEGHAGNVISAFGQFVIGGNFVVGIVVFLILIVIQFVVITNGAGRVAEVAARFTLDAMPGKQMAIDADLNAGLITDVIAKQRRRAVEREADFYGAMDGASKFVKGDAVAGIIIILINILGGFAIGVLQLKMQLAQALQTYTLLTVGEGLVSQLPALLISTATGIIVTRSGSEEHLGHDVVSQLLANRRAIQIVAVMLFLLGLAPGLPKVPFFGLGATLLFGARLLREQPAAPAETPAEAQKAEAGGEPETLAALLGVDKLELAIGYELIPIADKKTGSMLRRITAIRRQIAGELGVMLPTIRIRDNMDLPSGTYSVRLRGEEIARGDLMMGYHLAMRPGPDAEPVPGIDTREPVYGLPALWIDEAQKDFAEALGYTVVDPASVLSTHLTEVLRAHAPMLLGRQEVQALLDNARKDTPAVVDELVPNLLTLGDVQKVLQQLLRERIPIRDLATILEALADGARQTKAPEMLAEQARRALSRTIVNLYRGPDGGIHCLMIGSQLEAAIAGALQASDEGIVTALDPRTAERVVQRLAGRLEGLAANGHLPIVLTSPRTRLPLYKLVRRSLPSVVVLSYAETTDATVHGEGLIEIELEPGLPAPNETAEVQSN